MSRAALGLVLFLAASLAAQIDASPAQQALLRRAVGNEADYVRARGEYTYVQDFRFYAFDQRHRPGGQYEVTTDVTFTPDGRRLEHNLHGPINTLTILRLTNEDFTDLRHIVPFLLTPAVLSRYLIRFDRKEVVGLIDGGGRRIGFVAAEVFRVSPRQFFPGQRYFSGEIWVDPATAGIVQISGKPEPQIRKWVRGKEEENLFGRFTTYFQRIDGHYWFPVLTQGDDWLDFTAGPVEVAETVRFTRYRRFGSAAIIKLLPQR